MSTELQQAEDAAAISAGMLALSFACLPETWPVFTKWVNRKGMPFLAGREDMQVLIDNLTRRMYEADQ